MDNLKLIFLPWIVIFPVIVWRKLGNADYVAAMNPTLQTWIGAKQTTALTGKRSAELPAPWKRIQIALLFGLAWAALFIWIWIKAIPYLPFR